MIERVRRAFAQFSRGAREAIRALVVLSLGALFAFGFVLLFVEVMKLVW